MNLINQDIINEVVKIIKLMTYDDVVISLAGAHAKGEADINSDIDIYVFFNNVKPYEERNKIVSRYCDDINDTYITSDFNYPWGGSVDFKYKGIPIEIVFRQISQLDKIVNECLEGRFEIIPQTWTTNGYYTYIYLSEISFIKPIYDPNNLIEDYKQKIINYPVKLKQAIIRRFYYRASTWIDNFHYESAVLREDTLFTSAIVIHTILDMIQIIFALNEVYYTGDKKLPKKLKELPYCPKNLIDNLGLLLSSSEGNLRLQASILKDIHSELKEKCKEFL